MLPKYEELPERADGVRCGWHLFGENDNVGLVNLQTADRISAAASLIASGSVFRLDAPLNFLEPTLYGREPFQHHVKPYDDIDLEFDDWVDKFYLQVSSQWDSLAHVGAEPGLFYNGATADDVRSGKRNTIEHWAQRGIVGRAVLLDVAATLAEQGRPFRADEPYEITIDDLEAARLRAGVEYLEGDVLMVRTGFMPWYAGLDRLAREALAALSDPPNAGLQRSEAMVRYIWNSHASALVSDNTSVEVSPIPIPPGQPRTQYDFLHKTLIGLFGLALGEMFWLEDLAEHSAQDGNYTSFFVASPLFLPGAIGSPANAIAIK